MPLIMDASNLSHPKIPKQRKHKGRYNTYYEVYRWYNIEVQKKGMIYLDVSEHFVGT